MLEFQTACAGNGYMTHQIVSQKGTRFGTRYQAACGATFYVIKCANLEVCCKRCLAKMGGV